MRPWTRQQGDATPSSPPALDGQAGSQRRSAEDAVPAVSVIIATRNMATTLPIAVDSALRGGLEAIEILVVDDGSTDGTLESLSPWRWPGTRDPRVIYLRQPPLGKGAAVNRGLRHARSAFITLLDADDAIPPGSLALRHRAAAQGGAVDLVVGSLEIVDEGDPPRGRPLPVRRARSSLVRRLLLGPLSPFHLGCVLFSRSLAERVGPMDERLRRAEDIDYAVRLLKGARSHRVVDQAVYSYWRRRRSVVVRLEERVQALEGRQRVLRRHLSGPWRGPARLWVGLLDLSKGVHDVRSALRRTRRGRP